jgi:hypothetical protein
MKEKEFSALARSILQLHKDNNNTLNWRYPLPKDLEKNKMDQLTQVKNVLIQKGLIFPKNADDPHFTELSLDGYTFAGFELQ